MSQNDTATIGNGAKIIERFGGIRPMANKINVPVTTVQGWKKRDAIPAGRMEQIVQAAREHNLDISDILGTIPKVGVANENARAAPLEERPILSAEPRKPEPRKYPEFDTRFDTRTETPMKPATPVAPMPNVVYEDFAKKLSQAERKAVAKSTMVNIFLLLVVGMAIGLLLWPQSPISQDGRHLAALDEKVAQLRVDVAGVRKEQNETSMIIPGDIQVQISELKKQVAEASAVTATEATAAAQEVFGPDAGTLEQRIAKLEEHVSNIAGSPAMANIMARIEGMQGSPEGQQQLSQTWSELSSFVSGYQGAPQDMDASLHTAATQNPGMAATFQNIPPENMKASAMLFGMVQVRSMLGRENVPLERDLQILKNLAGSDDPELTAALDRMVPLAGRNGVMTVEGLTNQFQSVAGEVVEASLTGQDVSISDVAKAHLNQVMQVEKDGQLVSGTPEQAAIVQARAQLDAGDIAGAIATMQGLQGPAATVAQPWVQNANATLAAQQLQDQLTRAITMRAYGSNGITLSPSPLSAINRHNLYTPAKIVQ